MFIHPAALGLLTFTATNLTLHPAPATFGPSQDTPLTGQLAPVFLYDPNGTPNNHGCAFHKSYDFNFVKKPESELSTPPANWIALVQRGGCEHVEKVRVAQELGAIAVVVGNDQMDVMRYGDKDFIIGAGVDNSGLNIPAFGIKGEEYLQVLKLMEKNGKVDAGFEGLEVELVPHQKDHVTHHPDMPNMFGDRHPVQEKDESESMFWPLFFFFFFMIVASGASARKRAALDRAEAEAEHHPTTIVHGVQVNRYDSAPMEEAGLGHEAPPSYETPSAETTEVKKL